MPNLHDSFVKKTIHYNQNDDGDDYEYKCQFSLLVCRRCHSSWKKKLTFTFSASAICASFRTDA